MELYARARRAVLVDGMSRRAAAREFGLARKTVSKMLTYSAPPGYQRVWRQANVPVNDNQNSRLSLEGVSSPVCAVDAGWAGA